MTPAVWFHLHGVHVFPVHGKEPAVAKGTSQFDYRCTREEAARLKNYGVPLGRCGAGWLTVVDTDEAPDEAWVAANLLPTPFRVRTGKGWHRYFRATGPLPSYIHRSGLTIENRNQGLYVVGPGSRHPSGAVYTAAEWSWRWEDIPFFPADFVFDDGSCPHATTGGTGVPFVLPEVIFPKFRHDTLHKLMRALVAHGLGLDGAREVCYAVNRTHCRPPLDEKATHLDKFLTRAFDQRDRADFVRAPKTGWELAGALLEIGLSVDTTIAAVRSVTPDFDPEISE